MATATDRLTTASSFDDDYPAYTMGRAAEMTATTAGSRQPAPDPRTIVLPFLPHRLSGVCVRGRTEGMSTPQLRLLRER
ncbi:hypothetical protein GCM10009759_74840 [Kitasatospora saccharophila]|uniref:Uncharacterized protein n=1 Tax=Kitasatospora saccharophila TaxID=407973 RepID=A0ABP5JWE5_9ACTN